MQLLLGSFKEISQAPRAGNFYNPYFKLPNLSVLKVADPFVEKFQQKLSCIVHAG